VDIPLAPGPEFDRIRALVNAVGALGPVGPAEGGPGDDAAILDVPGGQRLVVSTDLSIEGVHFERAWLRWETIGYRALTAALSDLAAMAAGPLGALLSIALPPELDREVLDALGGGVGRALSVADCPLVGGDLSRSPGPVILDAAVLGSAVRPVGRTGAGPGDDLWVTGELGGAALAVSEWRQSLEPDPRARRAFEQPRARLEEARWLAEAASPTALIDISDGLAGDAAQLAAASDVRLEIDLERIPLAPPLEEFADRNVARRLALTGGEDYELLLTTPAGALESRRGAFEDRHGTRLTRIGRVTGGRGVAWRGAEGEEVALDLSGFDHFARAR
jgi:thiamine-monophosphate kinase